MNEGHVAFLGLERAREKVGRGDGLAEALQATARNTVFTTHTPVPAGNETFDRDLVQRYLEPWTQDVGCDPEAALGLGAGERQLQPHRARPSASPRSVNGVSRLHGEVSSGDVAAPVARHARRARWARSPTASTPRAGSARRCARSTRSTSAPTGSSHLLRPRATGTRARQIPDDELWARTARRRSGSSASCASGCASSRARHGLLARRAAARWRACSTRTPSPSASRAASPPTSARCWCSPTSTRLRALLDEPGAAGADHLRGQGAPRRPRGPGPHPPALPAHAGRVPRQARLPRGLRHRDGPHAGAGLRRLAQHAAPAAGGERHQRAEVADQRRRQPQHPRRLVGGGLRAATTAGPSADDANDADADAQDRDDAASLYQVLEEEVVPVFFERDGDGLPPPLDRDA